MATRQPASGESISTRRWPTIAGTSIAVLTVLAYVGLVVNGATTMIPSEDLDESYVAGSLWMLSWVPFGLVGGLLVARRPTHPVGWLMAVIALPIMLTVTLDAVATEAVARGWTGGWIPWTAWSASWIYAPVFPGLGLLLASFPTGRIGNRLLSKLAPIQYASIVGIAVLRGLRPGLTDTDGVHSPIDLPLSRELFDPAIGVVTSVTVVFFLIAGIDLVVRYVRARGVERAQLKWFAASFGFLVGAFVLLAEVLRPVLGEAFGHEVGEIIEILPFTLGLGGMATAIGIAVLRYRLFEIDRVVSRTVSYVLLTALLVGVYAAGVLGVGALVPGERSNLLVAASTLAVAALVRPLRSRTQRLVDRRFNRAGYDSTKTVEAFATRLRDQVDVELLTREVTDVARATLQPSGVSVWLREVPT